MDLEPECWTVPVSRQSNEKLVRQRPARVLNPAQADPQLRYEYDRGSGYEADMGLAAAFAALTPENELLHPDHRTFQLVHLISEYAWIGVHHELCRISAALDRDDLAETIALLDRARSLLGFPLHAIRLLGDSLPGTSMAVFRELFTPGATGLDSPGARNLRRCARVVWRSFEQLTERLGSSPADLRTARGGVRPPSQQIALAADVLAGLHRLDASTLEWKRAHLHVVWLLLGGGGYQDEPTGDTPKSMRGRPITDLQRIALQPLFPLLWSQKTVSYQPSEAASEGS